MGNTLLIKSRLMGPEPKPIEGIGRTVIDDTGIWTGPMGK